MKVDTLIFSKDRACQLDLLLASFQNMATGIEKVTVIYKATSDAFKQSYSNCKECHKSINFIEESNFKVNVFDWMQNSSSDFVMMLVDDIVFKEAIDFSNITQILEKNKNILCYSPRLGLHLTECYAMNSPQPVPTGNTQGDFFIWQWMNSQFDWNYMFSVDGHVFRKSEIYSWISHLNFSNPNTLEASMQEIPKTFALQPLGFCHIVSRLLNIPMNRVQNTFINRCENISHIELNDAYLEGNRLDSSQYQGNLNRGCHANLPALWRSK